MVRGQKEEVLAEEKQAPSRASLMLAINPRWYLEVDTIGPISENEILRK